MLAAPTISTRNPSDVFTSSIVSKTRSTLSSASASDPVIANGMIVVLRSEDTRRSSGSRK